MPGPRPSLGTADDPVVFDDSDSDHNNPPPPPPPPPSSARRSRPQANGRVTTVRNGHGVEDLSDSSDSDRGNLDKALRRREEHDSRRRSGPSALAQTPVNASPASSQQRQANGSPSTHRVNAGPSGSGSVRRANKGKRKGKKRADPDSDSSPPPRRASQRHASQRSNPVAGSDDVILISSDDNEDAAPPSRPGPRVKAAAPARPEKQASSSRLSELMEDARPGTWSNPEPLVVKRKGKEPASPANAASSSSRGTQRQPKLGEWGNFEPLVLNRKRASQRSPSPVADEPEAPKKRKLMKARKSTGGKRPRAHPSNADGGHLHPFPESPSAASPPPPDQVEPASPVSATSSRKGPSWATANKAPAKQRSTSQPRSVHESAPSRSRSISRPAAIRETSQARATPEAGPSRSQPAPSLMPADARTPSKGIPPRNSGSPLTPLPASVKPSPAPITTPLSARHTGGSPPPERTRPSASLDDDDVNDDALLAAVAAGADYDIGGNAADDDIPLEPLIEDSIPASPTGVEVANAGDIEIDDVGGIEVDEEFLGELLDLDTPEVGQSGPTSTNPATPRAEPVPGPNGEATPRAQSMSIPALPEIAIDDSAVDDALDDAAVDAAIDAAINADDDDPANMAVDGAEAGPSRRLRSQSKLTEDLLVTPPRQRLRDPVEIIEADDEEVLDSPPRISRKQWEFLMRSAQATSASKSDLFKGKESSDPSELAVSPSMKGQVNRTLDSSMIDMYHKMISGRRITNMELHCNMFETYISLMTADDEPNAPSIRVVNKLDGRPPDFEFQYSNKMLYAPNVPEPELGKGCGCEGGCDPESETCLCVKRQQLYFYNLGLKGFQYDEYGTLKANDCPIWECGPHCGCPPSCMNRVIQRGRSKSTMVELFKTRNKGWGVKAKSFIPRGTFIGIYSGELITEAESEMRGHVYELIGKTYLFDLDGYHISHIPEGLKQLDPRAYELAMIVKARAHSSKIKDLIENGKIRDESEATQEVLDEEDYSAYSVDALHYGFTRYINHSCNPNLATSQAYITDVHPERPLLVIFSRRNIQNGEELCISYKGIPDEDELLMEVPRRGGRGRQHKSKTSALAHVSPKVATRTTKERCRCGASNCDGVMFRSGVDA